jgi:hypothetical protein
MADRAVFFLMDTCVDVVSSDTCIKDQEKRDDVRLILRMNTTSFKLVQALLKSNGPTSSFCFIML